MSQILTEKLLTRPDGFAIPTATPAQRAACRVLDGVPLGELASHPDVEALVGGAEGLAQLPVGEPPREVVFLAAIRSAKTIIACAAAIRMALTVDVSKLGPGEVPRVSLLSLQLDASAVAYRLLLETIKASPTLRSLLIDDKSDALTLRHPSGRPVEIKTVAGSRAGGTLVARWSAGFVADEAPRMSGAADAVVNLDHAREAILGRLLPGAQALYIGSPHAPFGPVYSLVQEHWGKPSPGLVVMRGTGPMLNPSWWTPERCDALQQRNPTAYATDVQGEFADPESGLLSPFVLNDATRDEPIEVPPRPGHRYIAAVDPSEGSARGNGFALAVVELGDPIRVALVREWRGMSPDAIWAEIARTVAPYRIGRVYSDQYSGAASVDLAHRYGLRVEIEKTTATTKLETYTNLATLLSTGQLELSPDAQLRRDLLGIRKRTTQQGASIVLPKTSDGRHADLASALCSAVARAQTGRGRALEPGEVTDWARLNSKLHAAGGSMHSPDPRRTYHDGPARASRFGRWL